MRCFWSGKPFNPEGVVLISDQTGSEAAHFFEVTQTADELIITKAMLEQDIVYGVVQSMGSLNKCG